MTLIADMLLFAASVGAALYCYVLAARLRRFTTLEAGMGGAIAVLSAQVDEMTRVLEKAQAVAGQSGQRLAALTARAEELSTRLELLVASMHDIPPLAPTGAVSADTSRFIRPEMAEDARRARLVRRRPVMDHLEAAE
ncbi:hypothetical protein HOY34_15695 [Xinfangfangia sp. D13-10-4-6]|uniref:hypothetical protein n=1 Tax=Pseudogemmobacter hezensis TaxID=2737662 RepID=UPI0015548375|nr:hypothetical protein [Pseudogemmobacter hezensis]NPD16636.1 hypothetical protein [Pseudogemmobacter hezensis]